MGMVFCRGCGKEIHESARSCPHCGAQQKVNSKGESDREVSGVLLFLFGFLYLFFKGWFKAGLVYMLICFVWCCLAHHAALCQEICRLD